MSLSSRLIDSGRGKSVCALPGRGRGRQGGPSLGLELFNVRPYEGIYFHIFFLQFKVWWRLVLTWYCDDADNFRLHVFLNKQKQISSSFVKTDDSA